MPISISVGPPVLTINQGNTFMVTDLRGEIHPHAEQGIFAHDTRFVSAYRLTINQAEWKLLSSSNLAYYAAGFEFINSAIETADGHLPEQVSDRPLSPAHVQPWVARWGPIARPLLWSHAMYLILNDALGKKEPTR